MKEINNNIKEDYVSFEVAKLLKEKGFENPTLTSWENENGEIVESNIKDVFHPVNYNLKGWHKVSRPTHALAIEWIRVNHNIWIEIYPTVIEYNESKDKLKWTWRGQGLDKFYHNSRLKDTSFRDTTYYNSPQEAVESALKYVLTELIKN